MGIDFNVNPTIASSLQYNYRNKASFAYGNNAGFYKEHSNEIVPIHSCALQDNLINKIYTTFNNYLNKNKQIRANIKNLVVRVINNQVLIGVVANKHIDIANFYNEALTSSGLKDVGLYLIVNTRKDAVVLAGKTEHIAGIKQININNFNIDYNVDLLAFHQNNIDIQNKIYNKVLSYVTTNSIVINGFSGAGLLSAIIAKKVKQVYGVEINKSAHNSAQNLKKVNKINNLTNILGDFNKYFKTLNADCLVLDPAKKGCGKDVCQQISKINNIIYISCNPIALAKDLQYLLKNYIIEEITPYDMFPNTNSVETVVKLKLKD